MKTTLCTLFFFVLLAPLSLAQKPYFPAADNWERRTPQQANLDATKLKEAVDFAIASESKAPRNLELAHYQTFGREPFGEAAIVSHPPHCKRPRPRVQQGPCSDDPDLRI